MDIKRELKSRKISCRWISSRGGSLSSVVVEKNNLIEKGDDFVVVFGDDKKNYLGKTRAVQDFEGLSFRDYERPARDSHSGMIPPKLAQIMLNIGLQGETKLSGSSTSGKVVLDPFCGSGTILMEAMLLGVQEVIGSDVSEKAVKNSWKNLEWVQEKFYLSEKINFEVKKGSAVKLSSVIEPGSIDLIVTEPYLGPQEKTEKIEKAKKDLEVLYSKSLQEFRKVLKPEGRVVMIWPVLRKAEKEFLNIKMDGFKILKQIPDGLNLKMTDRDTIVYGRKGQRVWREIVVLEKD